MVRIDLMIGEPARRQLVWLFAAMVALSATIAEAAPAKPRCFWSGSCEGFQVQWSAADLTVTDAQKAVVFSARKLAKENFERLKKEAKGKRFSYEENYELLSLVGPYLSFEYHVYADGGDTKGGASQPAAATRYVTVDLRKPENLSERLSRLLSGQPTADLPMARLNDVFSSNDILAALKNDTVIQAIIDPGKASDLKTMVGLLNKKDLPEPDMCGTFDDSLLNEFCIHHLRGDNAVVRLGISGRASCRESISELGLAIPYGKDRKAALKAADDGKAGILAGALKQSTGKARTHISF